MTRSNELTPDELVGYVENCIESGKLKAAFSACKDTAESIRFTDAKHAAILATNECEKHEVDDLKGIADAREGNRLADKALNLADEISKHSKEETRGVAQLLRRKPLLMIALFAVAIAAAYLFVIWVGSGRSASWNATWQRLEAIAADELMAASTQESMRSAFQAKNEIDPARVLQVPYYAFRIVLPPGMLPAKVSFKQDENEGVAAAIATSGPGSAVAFQESMISEDSSFALFLFPMSLDAEEAIHLRMDSEGELPMDQYLSVTKEPEHE